MPANSLTLLSVCGFETDPIKHGIIDWATCIHIIEGIVQGLLSLHQYFMLQIIHRN
jgi:hypothetical protein